MNSFTRGLGQNPVENKRCAAKPFGCDKPIVGLAEHTNMYTFPACFKDALSWKEYHISGLCQQCQDSVFDEPEQYSDDAEEYERNQLTNDGHDD